MKTTVLAVSLLVTLPGVTVSIAAEATPKTSEKRDTLLYVRTNPPGAKVLINGTEVGTSNHLFPADPGTAMIEVELDGHKSTTKKVIIQANNITRVTLKLEPETTEEAAGGRGDALQLSQQGWALWQKGQFDAAIPKFREAVKLAPRNENALNGLGWACFNSGNFAEAKKAFEKLIAINPRHPAALNGLGQMYFAQKQYGMAEKYLLKAAPQAPAAWYGLTKLYLLQGKFEEAEKFAQRIEESGQADDGARRMLKAAKEKKLPEGLRAVIEPQPAAERLGSAFPETSGHSAANSGVKPKIEAPDETDSEAVLRNRVAAFVAAATKGDPISLEHFGPEAVQIRSWTRDMRRAIAAGVKASEIRLVHVGRDQALVATEFAQLTDKKYKQPVCVVYVFVRQNNRWALNDIDLENAKGLASELERIGAIALPEHTNILNNSSFEFGDILPADWERMPVVVQGVQYSWDKKVAYEGKASMCVEKTLPRYFPIAAWSQTVDRQGDKTTLHVSAAVKAVKMTKAVLDVEFIDEHGTSTHQWAAYIGAKEPSDLPATHDWKQYSGEVQIPPQAKKLRVAVQVYGPGKMWFDDVQAQYK